MDRRLAVNSDDMWLKLLQDYFIPHLEENEFDIPNIWFQQEEVAGAEIARAGWPRNVTRSFLRDIRRPRNGDIRGHQIFCSPISAPATSSYGVFEVKSLP